jgi:hypothetical protein
VTGKQRTDIGETKGGLTTIHGRLTIFTVSVGRRATRRSRRPTAHCSGQERGRLRKDASFPRAVRRGQGPFSDDGSASGPIPVRAGRCRCDRADAGVNGPMLVRAGLDCKTAADTLSISIQLYNLNRCGAVGSMPCQYNLRYAVVSAQCDMLSGCVTPANTPTVRPVAAPELAQGVAKA